MKEAVIDIFGRRPKRRVNHREAEQIPPIPARICNGTPGFPAYFATNGIGLRLKVNSQNDLNRRALSVG